jgi:hypothetical protein
VSEFSVTPSTLQAGGSPKATIVNAFDYGGADDDVREVTVQLPAGLVGNPLVPARCAPQQFAADACPASTPRGWATQSSHRYARSSSLRGRIMEIRAALDREIGVRVPAPQLA